MIIIEYIDQKLIEWKGKTIADNDHFQSELKKTLIDVAKFTSDKNIGMLRQWLNEGRITDSGKMVTNEEINMI